MLADIKPYYNYQGTSKELEGYKYKVILPLHKMDALEVKIPGAKQIELADGEYPLIEFEGLEARIYVIEGKGMVSATAKGIRVLGPEKA